MSVHSDAKRFVTRNWDKDDPSQVALQEDFIRVKWNGREIRNGTSCLLPAFHAANAVVKLFKLRLLLRPTLPTARRDRENNRTKLCYERVIYKA